ncbi:MAG: ATP synthase F1 subunit epsilon [Verrucomicrobiae bacterium]|nr:ATP synthase F1 subunit epsilon [Verrucomicrobiae bacterium]
MAGERTYRLEVLTLQRMFWQGDVRFVIAPGQEGLFEVLAGHAPYVFALKPGVLHVRLPDDRNQYMAVGGGFLVVQPDRTSVLTRSAELPEEIDVPRAQRARERAEKRLMERGEGVDVPRAQAALARALARLKVAEYAAAQTR